MWKIIRLGQTVLQSELGHHIGAVCVLGIANLMLAVLVAVHKWHVVLDPAAGSGESYESAVQLVVESVLFIIASW
jgi:hypothetical protein